MATERAKYYFKCPSAVQRHDWIHAITSASKALVVSPLCLWGNVSPRHSSAAELENIAGFLSGSERNTDLDTSESLEDDSPMPHQSPSAIDEDDVVGSENQGEDPAPHQLIIVESQSTESSQQATNFLTRQHDESRSNENCSSSRSAESSPLPRSVAKQRVVFRLPSQTRKVVPANRLCLPNVASRPSTSPERRSNSLFPVQFQVGNPTSAMAFSRHLVASAPDIQSLVIEDD